jgi:protein dithiol oxidoreductase (disulfide-forming)
MNRRQATTSIAALTALGSAHAQPTAPVEGTQFTTLREAQPSSSPGKVEVIEFFSYACPACNAFDPILERWVATLPADTAFRRIPVPFLANADNFQRTFYALQITGLSAKVHGKIFEAVHVGKQRLLKPEEIAEVVANAGGDKVAFLSAFNSFSMSSFVTRAKSAASNYRIDQIPALAIAGRYITSPAQAGGAQQALALAAALIQKARPVQPARSRAER